jgi:hypothetical protein
MTQTPETFFAADYVEARAKFLEAAHKAGAQVRSVEHPSAKGPHNQPIFMDCAVLGASNAPHALIVISGTHGPEGYCGSGVQIGLLSEGLANKWAAEMRVILIHAHNAYGFAWDTRFNEDNIDLNRNYLESFDAPLPENPNYGLLAHLAGPATRDTATVEAAERGLLGFAAEHGFPALQSALSGGQYSMHSWPQPVPGLPKLSQSICILALALSAMAKSLPRPHRAAPITSTKPAFGATKSARPKMAPQFLPICQVRWTTHWCARLHRLGVLVWPLSLVQLIR